MASQGGDTCLCRWQVWAGEVALQSVRLPGPMCTSGWLLCSPGQEWVLVLQDGVGSQGMGAVPRVGSRNRAEMPLAQSVGSSGGGRDVAWLGGAACVGAQHGSSDLGSIQSQVDPSPMGHLEGGNSQGWQDTEWQCLVHTGSPLAMWDALGVSAARGAPAGENRAGLWVEQLAGQGGPCRQCSCRWHQSCDSRLDLGGGTGGDLRLLLPSTVGDVDPCEQRGT